MVPISTVLSKWKIRLLDHAHVFAFIVLVIQPVMDVVSYWCTEFRLSGGITLLMRMGVMGLSILWGYWISDRKKAYWIAAGILALIYAGHAFACMQVGYADIVGDISNYIRVAQMPIMMIVFTTCLRQNKKTMRWLLAGAAAALLVVLAVELLSVVTGTDPHTYSDDGTGILGWFYNTNSQSAILGMLTPFLLLWLLLKQKKNPVWVLLAAAVSCGALFMLGTRLAYASIFAALVGLAVTVLLVRRQCWSSAVGFLALAVVFAGLIKVSPMYLHQHNYEAIQSERQEETDELEIKIPGLSDGEEGEEGKKEMTPEQYAEMIENLTPLYEKYVGDFVDIFGAEETMKMYHFTTDSFEFSNVRQKKLRFSEALMDCSPFSSRLFGLELSRFTVNGNIYDVENDFHGIYYLYGAVGLIAYLVFLLYFVGLVLWALFKNIKQYFTLTAATQGIALCVCMAHAYNTAGVLRRPNASIYLSLVLALIYYLVLIRDYKKGSEEIL